MYQIRIDITENNGLTKSYDPENRYHTLKEARYAAQETRNRLFQNYAMGEFKDYKVDILPAN